MGRFEEGAFELIGTVGAITIGTLQGRGAALLLLMVLLVLFLVLLLLLMVLLLVLFLVLLLLTEV